MNSEYIKNIPETTKSPDFDSQSKPDDSGNDSGSQSESPDFDNQSKSSDFDRNGDSPLPIKPVYLEESECKKEFQKDFKKESKIYQSKSFMSKIFGDNNIFSKILNYKSNTEKNKFYNFSDLANYDNNYKERCISLFCKNRLENIEKYYDIVKKIIFSKCNEIYYDLMYLKPIEMNDYKSKVSLSVSFHNTIQETLENNNYIDKFKNLDLEAKQYILHDYEINDIANVIIDEIKEYGYDSSYSRKEKCFYIYYKYHDIDEEIKKNISKNIANFRKRKREE
jgi:hypothetical protein